MKILLLLLRFFFHKYVDTLVIAKKACYIYVEAPIRYLLIYTALSIMFCFIDYVKLSDHVTYAFLTNTLHLPVSF